MTNAKIRAFALLAALLLPVAGTAQQWNALETVPQPNQTRQPKNVAMCLPPGGKPTPCGTARTGQTLRLQLAKTHLPSGPIQLRFVEEASTGRPQRTASVTIPPARSLDGGYEVQVPAQLCAGARGNEGQFEIQMLTSDLQNSESGANRTADSLGYFQMRCD